MPAANYPLPADAFSIEPLAIAGILTPSSIRASGEAGEDVFKVDLRWGTGGTHGRLSDALKISRADLAIASFRDYLRRDDLSGQAVAARFVVNGQSLYYSEFDKPFGAGRIHPDAPLDPMLNKKADRAKIERIIGWVPEEGPRPDLRQALAPFLEAAAKLPADWAGSRPVITIPRGDLPGVIVAVTVDELLALIAAAKTDGLA